MSETQVTTEVQFENIDDLDAFSTGFFGQKQDEVKAPESKTTEAAEQDDTEAQPSDDTEAQTDDEQDEVEAKEEIPETPKRKTVQDRIDEVVRQREELKRESAAEIAKLRQELEDFKKNTIKEEVPSEAKEPSPDAVGKDGEPLYALGEFDPQYIRDLTRFTLEQERTKVQAEAEEARQVAEAKQAHEALQTTWNAKLDASVQEYPDLIEKSRDLLNDFTDLEPNYAGYLSTVLMSMDKGPEVLYYLATHPDEAKAIVNSGAQKATLALGRIEARFDKDEQIAPKPKVSKAPVPPTDRARGTNGAFVAVAPDTDDLDAFTQEFFRKK